MVTIDMQFYYLFCIFLIFHVVNQSTSSSSCPDELCDAVYDDTLSVLRADDGDVIFPASANSDTCHSLKAVCLGDSCHACKCPLTKDTFNNWKKKCEKFANGKFLSVCMCTLYNNSTCIQ